MVLYQPYNGLPSPEAEFRIVVLHSLFSITLSLELKVSLYLVVAEAMKFKFGKEVVELSWDTQAAATMAEETVRRS